MDDFSFPYARPARDTGPPGRSFSTAALICARYTTPHATHVRVTARLCALGRERERERESVRALRRETASKQARHISEMQRMRFMNNKWREPLVF